MIEGVCGIPLPGVPPYPRKPLPPFSWPGGV